MNKKIQLIVLCMAFLGLGLSMPSCPGQQAMQQQIDALKGKIDENEKQIQILITKLDHTNSEIGQMTTIVAQLNTVLTEQKQQMEQMGASIKSLNEKLAAPKTTAKPTAKTVKKRGH